MGGQYNLIEYQNKVQANGATLFMAMIAPDKLTAYSEFIGNDNVAHLSRIEETADTEGLNLVRIHKPLIEAIHDGVIDVYLPNDTHWGSAGHSNVADEL